MHVADLTDILKYDCLFLAPHLDDVALSCPARVLEENATGKKVLIATLFSHPGATDAGRFKTADYLNRREEDRKAVLELFKNQEGIAGIVTPEEFAKYGLPSPDAYRQMADLILVAKDGYGFSATATGEEFVVRSETTVGTHGFLSTNPKMNATFIASGAGIRQGETIDVVENIDLAPTIARLLNVPFEADGKPVMKALVGE